MKLNTIRFKISILYTSILALIFSVYTVVLYFTFSYNIYDVVDDKLELKAQGLSGILTSYLSALGYSQESFISAAKRSIILEETHEGEDRIKEMHNFWSSHFDALGLRADYIGYLDPQGNAIVASRDMRQEQLSLLKSSAVKAYQEEENVVKNIKYKKQTLRIISAPFYYENEVKYIIQVGTTIEDIIALIRQRLLQRLLPIPVILFFSFFIGRMFTERILRPVREVTETAKAITYEDLSARVKTEHMDEEMRYLTGAFNEMITRLEKSFKYISEFSSNVAHELKTPLAIMRGESELALRKERTPEEYKAVLKVNLEEAQRMLRIVEDLLLLGKVEYRPELLKFEQFDFTEFLKEICEQARILADKKNIALNCDIFKEQKVIRAHKILLRRLFFNLIENAIKFTPENGRIDIRPSCTDNQAEIAISDTGIGISEKDLPKVFDKFFRTEKEGFSSSGLGLSIAQSIAKLHSGTITAESKLQQGSTFTVTLPLPS